MKNTYIIAIKEGGQPYFIQQKPNNDITYIGKNYRNAYIMESKAKAEETRRKRYETREERRKDPKYTEWY